MPIEIMDMDASEVAEAPAVPMPARASANRSGSLRRLEREMRVCEERLVRRMAD